MRSVFVAPEMSLHRGNNQKCSQVVPVAAPWLLADTILMSIRQSQPRPFRRSRPRVIGRCHSKEKQKVHHRGLFQGCRNSYLMMLLLVIWWIIDLISLLSFFYKYS